MKEEEKYRTILIISAAMQLYFFFSHRILFIYINFGIVILSSLVPKIAFGIHFLWFKLSDIISKIMPPIIFSIFYYIFLVPFSVIYKIKNKSRPFTKSRNTDSTFVVRDKQYIKHDFKNPW